MRYTNNEINNIVNKSKMLVDMLHEYKESPDELKDIEYLVFAGLLSYYGDECANTIFKAFQNINFVYNKGSAYEGLVNHLNLSPEVLEYVQIGKPGAFVYSEVGISPTSNDVNAKYTIYLFDDNDSSFIRLLEDAIHEINHIVNSVEKVVWSSEGSYYARMGLSFSRFESNELPKFIHLEESINVLQSHEILKHILEFNDYSIFDSDFRKSLGKLSGISYEDREPAGYEPIVPIVEPLYEDLQFNFVLKKKRISGDIENIFYEFDSKTVPGSLERLADSLDSIILNDKEYFKNALTADEIVKQYLKS